MVDSNTLWRSKAVAFCRLSALFAIPIFVAAGIYAFSPNFKSSEPPRQTPLGSDFLQEWVGGTIWASSNRNLLYDPEHFRAVQHDASLVGFEWPEEKYYPMVYPPFYYMFLSPLAQLPYRHAMCIWLLLLSITAGCTVFVLTRFYPPMQRHAGKSVLAMMVFSPVLMSLNMGHKSILILFLFTATYLLLYHRKPFSAGVVFGLLAFKPHLGILFAVVMLLKRQWWFVSGGMLTTVVLVGCCWLAGPNLCHDYFNQCLTMGDYSQTAGYQLVESHNLIGAVGISLGAQVPTELQRFILGLLATVVISLLAMAIRGTWDFRSHRFALRFSALVIGTILLSPHFYVYDLSLALLPMALIVVALFYRGGHRELVRNTNVGDWELKVLTIACVALFVGGGTASMIAAHLYVQPTVLIMLAILFAISRVVIQSSPAQRTTHNRPSLASVRPLVDS